MPRTAQLFIRQTATALLVAALLLVSSPASVHSFEASSITRRSRCSSTTPSCKSSFCRYRHTCRHGPRPSHLHARYKDIKDEELQRQNSLRRRLWKFRKGLRYLFQKYTVYVLACENGKFYVGSTTHKRQRFRQHMGFDDRRGGSAWTRLHKPVKVVKQVRRVSARHYLGTEAKITAEYMHKYGVNNVRGAMFSECRKYNIKDIDSLTGFLGHFNDLSYHNVRNHLEQTLPAAPIDQEDTDAKLRAKSKETHRVRRRRIKMGKKTTTTTKKKKYMVDRATDKCFNCGAIGHYSWECPNGPTRTCFVCGEEGHFAADCPNK